MGKRYICLDIGGTKILGAVFDENDSIIYKTKKKAKAEEGFEETEQSIIKVIEELVKESGTGAGELAGIAAGAPGAVNEKDGVILYAPNLPWKNYNIRSTFETRFGVPFFIGNDANTGILGEWKYGAGKGKSNVIGLFVGTGIGGGIIIDNKLFTGSRHVGAEVGHMTLNTEGPYCNCGQRGCLEAYASKIAITREINSQLQRGRESMLKDLMDEKLQALKSKALKKAIDANDSLAGEVLDRAVYYLAAGAGSLINIFNPEMFILGGGVLEALGGYVMPAFKKYLERFTWPEILEGTAIVKSKLGDNAIIYGALAMIRNGESREG